MAGFGVIINPHAGQNRREANRLARCVEVVGDAGVVHAPDSLEELERVCAELRDRDVEVLAVCGGDGSYFRALSAILGVYGERPLPMFLPLRAGSMNTLVRSIGCRDGSPDRVLAHAVAEYRSGRRFETVERQLLVVQESQVGFMVGAGAIVNFLQVYYASAGRGPWAATKLVARAVVSGLLGTSLLRGILQGFEADLDCDGERVAQRVFNLLYASSITEIGLGFKVAYLATRKPGFFHLLAGRLTAGQLIPRLRRVWRGWPMEVDTVYDNLAQRVRVEFARPTHYMIDGDVLDAVDRLTVRAGPRLTIIKK